MKYLFLIVFLLGSCASDVESKEHPSPSPTSMGYEEVDAYNVISYGNDRSANTVCEENTTLPCGEVFLKCENGLSYSCLNNVVFTKIVIKRKVE